MRSFLRELQLSLQVRVYNGKLKVLQGFRVRYNNLQTYKGGVGFHPKQSLWRALTRLASRGSRGWGICNPKELSKGELERLSLEYICGICNIIGSQKEATKAKGWA